MDWCNLGFRISLMISIIVLASGKSQVEDLVGGVDSGLLLDIFGDDLSNVDRCKSGSFGEICSDHGYCDDQGQCVCEDGYQGQLCEVCQACREPSCSDLEGCVKCKVAKDFWTADGFMFECLAKCANLTFEESSSPYENLFNCKATAFGGLCEIEFTKTTENEGLIKHSQLVCQAFEEDDRKEGKFWGQQDCDSSGYDPAVSGGYGFLSYAAEDDFGRKEYRGQFSCHPKRHGKGYLEWNDGAYYAGHFQDGIRTGQGYLFYPNGDFYFGEWFNDTKQGNGTYLWKTSGHVYNGAFRYGAQHGYGEIYSKDDLEMPVFTGTFADGKKVAGVMRFTNGDVYNGEFESNLFHGQGRYQDACGNVYVGQWQGGLRYGDDGQFEWVNGERYQGQFVDDLPHGQGIYVWMDGSRFEGRFEKGQMVEAEGEYTFAIDERKIERASESEI